MLVGPAGRDGILGAGSATNPAAARIRRMSTAKPKMLTYQGLRRSPTARGGLDWGAGILGWRLNRLGAFRFWRWCRWTGVSFIPLPIVRTTFRWIGQDGMRGVDVLQA